MKLRKKKTLTQKFTINICNCIFFLRAIPARLSINYINKTKWRASIL